MTVSLLITRPRSAAEGFADRVRARLGHEVPVVVSPLMRIDPVRNAIPALSEIGALVITSPHAISALTGLPGASGLVCYCVGTATAQAAQTAGLTAIDGGGTARTLMRRIVADAPDAPLLYLRGEHVAADLAKILSRAGLETYETIVYRQTPQPLTDAARTLLQRKNPVVLPLFSPRSARLFFDTRPCAPLFIAAISHNVADAVPHATRLRIAASATADAMLDTVEALASDAKRVESGNGPQ